MSEPTHHPAPRCGRDAIVALLIGDGEEISLAPGVIDCDATRLQTLIPEGSRGSLAEAVDLYKGRFLSDVNIAEEAWADWLAGEQQRLADLSHSFPVHTLSEEGLVLR